MVSKNWRTACIVIAVMYLAVVVYMSDVLNPFNHPAVDKTWVPWGADFVTIMFYLEDDTITQDELERQVELYLSHLIKKD